MKPLIRRTVIVLIIFVVAALILFYVMRDKPVSVVVHVVDSGRVEATVANTRSGTVKACRRARLAPAMGGQIHELSVHEGDRVEAGQVVAYMGESGQASGPHLHFEIWRQGEAVDPRTVVAGDPPRN